MRFSWEGVGMSIYLLQMSLQNLTHPKEQKCLQNSPLGRSTAQDPAGCLVELKQLIKAEILFVWNQSPTNVNDVGM